MHEVSIWWRHGDALMPIIHVSLDRARATTRTVQFRTSRVRAGVLCEVWLDDEMELCLVDRVNEDGSIEVRRLPPAPEPPKNS